MARDSRFHRRQHTDTISLRCVCTPGPDLVVVRYADNAWCFDLASLANVAARTGLTSRRNPSIVVVLAIRFDPVLLKRVDHHQPATILCEVFDSVPDPFE